MKNALFFLLIALSFSVSATSLEDQINAVNQAQTDRKLSEQEAAQAAKVEQEQQERMRLEQEQKIAASNAASAEKKRRNAQAAAAEKNSERLGDKKRDQSFEDELRQLELEDRKLELAAKKAKVQRSNEYIDQELKQQAAETDVIKSEADATRNISEGGKDLLKSEGKAREEKASHMFNN